MYNLERKAIFQKHNFCLIFVLSSKNNPILEVRFRDLVPISLSGLDYAQQATDIDYLRATITFTYKIYEFANVGASATTETTS